MTRGKSAGGLTVLVLGADGYIGWPMAMHLSRLGHQVVAVDNLARRRWDREGGTYSLLPIKSMPQRVRRWQQLTGNRIDWRRADLTDFPAVDRLFEEFEPEAVVHFAEQRSAPFSMVDREHAVFTQVNNVAGTLNLLFAIRDRAPDCHLIKLGTMGEYGTPNIDIEEGYLDIEHNGRRDRLPFPKVAGQLLPSLQGARQRQHPLRLPGLGDQGHRPQSGGGLWGRDRGHCAPPRPNDLLLLRLDLWPRAQSVLRPGGGRAAAHGVRQGRADPRLSRYPRHHGLHHPCPGESRRAQRVPSLQPVHRAVQRQRAGGADLQGQAATGAEDRRLPHPQP